MAFAVLLAPAAAGERQLAIRDWPETATLPLGSEPESLPPPPEGTVLVAGRFGPPDFSIGDLSQVQLTDARGEPIPLVIEEASLLREFGGIAGMAFAFELPLESLAAGFPRIVWGAGISAAYRAVPRLVMPQSARDRLRSFVLDAPEGGEAPAGQFATIEIIADSHADVYYLWYLLPMVVIFVLLAVRKAMAR